MNFLKLIITDPFIIIVVFYFIFSVWYMVTNYKSINRKIIETISYLKKYKKEDVLYRFQEFNNDLFKMGYINQAWFGYKSYLIFNQNILIKKQDDSISLDSVSPTSNIQTTIDPAFYFNEENLIHTQYNHKFLMATPTILTGLGPLFTFLSIAIGFSGVDFSSPENTIVSVTNLMGAIKIAALVSVTAVASSLIFLIVDRVLYKKLCKIPVIKLQDEFNRLFEHISSEKFLIDLLKENKIHSIKLADSFKTLSDTLQNNLSETIDSLAPYLENIIYSINRLNNNANTEELAKRLFSED